MMGLTIGLAWVTYTLVERPVQWAPQLAALRPTYLLGGAVTAAAAVASLPVSITPRTTTDDHVEPLTEALTAAGTAAPAADLPANVTPTLDDVDATSRRSTKAATVSSSTRSQTPAACSDSRAPIGRWS